MPYLITLATTPNMRLCRFHLTTRLLNNYLMLLLYLYVIDSARGIKNEEAISACTLPAGFAAKNLIGLEKHSPSFTLLGLWATSAKLNMASLVV
jgi:hypothetical protein